MLRPSGWGWGSVATLWSCRFSLSPTAHSYSLGLPAGWAIHAGAGQQAARLGSQLGVECKPALSWEPRAGSPSILHALPSGQPFVPGAPTNIHVSSAPLVLIQQLVVSAAGLKGDPQSNGKIASHDTTPIIAANSSPAPPVIVTAGRVRPPQ